MYSRIYTNYGGAVREKRISLLAIGLVLLFLSTSCSASNESNEDSASGSAVPAATDLWNQESKDSIVAECKLDDSLSQGYCQCFAEEVSISYSSPSEWNLAWDQIDQTGVATNAFMRITDTCDDKFGSVGGSGSGEGETEQASYPPCVQVLAPGNSGLKINDNRKVLGRADQQPGYCVLENSGGELYYYPGR
jgi:hypothetical protein